MKAASHQSSNNSRRGWAVAVVLGFLAGAGSVVSHAANLVLQGATTASCTYSTATMNAAGDLTITTGTSCGLVPPVPDTLAFATPTPTTFAVTGSATVSVTRSNPTATGGVSGTVTATGGCVVSNGGAFIFGTTSTTPQTMTITAPSATTCTISLTATTPASLGTPNTFPLTVTAVAAPPDTLAFSSASAAVASSGSTTVNVTRASANTTGGVSATLGVSGGCALSSTSASFPGTQTTAVPVTVTAPAGPTTCVVTLAPSTGAVAGAPASFTMTVAPPVLPTTPGCTTAANTNFDIRTSGRSSIILGAGQSSAVKFYEPGDGKLGGTLSTAETTAAALPPNIQVNISRCPGDFTVTSEACGSLAYGHSSTTTYNVGSGPFWNCVVDSTKTWYINVRFPSCNGTCGVLMDRY